MKILVPTDFSKTADRALRYALTFATTGSTIILHHAFMPLESGFYSQKRKGEDNLELGKEVKAQLKELAEQAAEIRGDVSFEIALDKGVGERCILKAATSRKVDLIVMGTTGASGLKEKLIGSVTADVMNQASCPVIGVPEKYVERPLKHIAFASDYMLEDLEALKWVSQVAERFRAKVVITHFDLSQSPDAHRKTLSATYRTLVKQMVPYPGITYHVQPAKDIAEALKKLSQTKNLDLLAMITHRRKGFFQKLLNQSVTKQVSYQSQVPLLSFPIH